ncbi:MAG: DUF1206 domain-containing protein [Ilumatobacteraceae bacterium]
MTATTGVTTGGGAMARSWRDPLGRAGIAARGVLYLLLGVLAIQFARGEASSDEVNQTGAIQTLAEQPLGKFLLVALTLGLVALCVWRLIQTFVGDPVEGDEAKDRVKYFGKAVIYGALVVTAVKITIDNWDGGGSTSQTQSGNGDQQQQQATSTLFDLPAGRWLVGILGVVLIGAAVYEVYHHTVQASFMKRMAPSGDGSSGAIELFGRIGYAARSVVWAISGIFFIVAAVDYDPNESKGISGALQELADHSWGPIILWATAIGLFLFGLFCLLESRYRKHS